MTIMRAIRRKWRCRLRTALNRGGDFPVKLGGGADSAGHRPAHSPIYGNGGDGRG